jgi:hypothetical protein
MDDWEERGEMIRNKRKRVERAKQTVMDELTHTDQEDRFGDDGKSLSSYFYLFIYF